MMLACLLAERTSDEVWRLEHSWRYAPWLTVLAVAGMVTLVAYCYARELSPAGRFYRWALGGLRMTTIALLMVMLSELLLAGTRSGRPIFAVLVDQSASMGVADAVPDEELPDSLKALVAGDSASPIRRIDLAKAALSNEEVDLLGQLSKDYDLQVYTSAETLQALPPGDSGWNDAVQQIAIDNAAPSTKLGEAIEQVLSGTNGQSPQGALIITDGRVTSGRPLSAAAESARRGGMPLYLLGVGSRNEPPDVALANVLAEEVVFVDDLVSFQVVVRTTSSVEGPVRVALRREGDAAVIVEQVIEPAADGGATPVQLIHRPEKPGTFRYLLTATSGTEELNKANNTATHTLSVRDQKVRVLLAAGGPSYEFRYLKHLLERDSTVELDSFLQEADLEYASADPSAISRLPLRESEIDSYDVVVLMDLDPGLTPRSFWPGLRRFVTEQGGGLAMVAGQRYLPSAYRDLPDFASLYPANISGPGVGDAFTDDGYRIAPTPIGLQRAPMQLADNSTATTLVWNRLPSLYWYAEVGPLKPAAQVLATHPTAISADGSPAPLVVSQYVGSGQVVLHAIDSTYRWRRRTGDVYFARYWVQTLRALARGRLSAAQGELELTADRRQYKPGETVRLRLRADAANTEGVTVLLQPESGPQQTIQLSPASDTRGVYEAGVGSLPIGRYRALLADGAAGDGAATSFEIVAPPGEFTRLEMATKEMQDAADQSRGAFFTLDELDTLTDALPKARRVPIESLPPEELWNRWWMIAAICGCLTTEWILRKRKSML